MDNNVVKSDQTCARTVQITIPGLPQTVEEMEAYIASEDGQIGRSVDKKRTAVRKKLFFEAYAKTWGKVYFSCQKIGISYNCYSKWMQNDPAFKEAIEGIDGQIADMLEYNIDLKILKDKNDHWLSKKLAIMRPDRWGQATKLAFNGNLHIVLDEDADDSTSKTNTI